MFFLKDLHLYFLGKTHLYIFYMFMTDSACLLPFHAPIRAPTSSNGCIFSFFLSNLIISPLILRRWGRALFCSNQIKPRMREHGWAHGRGAGKSRPFMTVFLISTHDSSCLMLDACFCKDLHVVFSHWYKT